VSYIRLARLTAMLACTQMALPVPSFAACTISSGPRTTALIELYTSEGCSSCPPADKQLSHLESVLDAGAAVVPLALHVTYWDYIGWKDPYAQATFDKRQLWLVQVTGNASVYTPHFFVAGAESRDWSSSLRTEVRQQNAQEAQAKVTLQGHLARPGVMSLLAQASVQVNTPKAALFLALTESKLSSSVARGENAGATLAHDHVVRALLGPIALPHGVGSVQQDVLLDPRWSSAQLTAVAFVQDQVTGRVLQAISALACAQP